MIENPTEEQLKTLTYIVYLITNIINGKQYIGVTTLSFRGRYRSSKNMWKYASNEYFKNAILKYGYQNFKVSIILFDAPSKEELSILEIKYIKEFNTMYPNGYNFDEGGYKSYERHVTNTKDWIFYDHLLEKEIHTNNLQQFCKDRGLVAQCMNSIHNKRELGLRKHHKQYTLPGVKLKKWKIKSPEGEIFTVFEWNTPMFCRKHNLKPSGISAICRGDLLTYMGWTCPDANAREKRRYKIKHLDGRIVELVEGEISEFCRLNNLSNTALSNMLCGRNFNYNGWTLFETKIEYCELINPDNKELKIPKLKGQLKEFCKRNFLNYKKIQPLNNGSLKEVNGWKLLNSIENL